MNITKAFQSVTARTMLGVALPLAIAGCAITPASPDGASNHPANAHAASSPLPAFQTGLLAITNMVMVKPVTEPAPQHQHGHEKHETKPKTEEKK
jgi:hypothetical protein